ncbi:hypothetical protein ANAEL_01421 [Anaerolineales bacterium]|nr:hypothetical protein ANAEL_01421 [Anaerolineales bacterium]
MESKRNIRWLVVSLIVIFSLSCNLGITAAPTEVNQSPTDNQPMQGQPSPTAETPLEATTIIPVLTDTPQPTATTGPQCTTLQDLNLRKGPGQAYSDPIDTLPQNTVLVPLAYNPQGVPTGSWVMIQNSSNGQKGWVNAASQYVSCNIDLTNLAPLAVEPPPAPTPPRASSSVIDGTCGIGNGTFYDCEVKARNNGIIQVRLQLNGKNAGKDEGIKNVNFVVFADDGSEVFNTVEENAPYCIFGDSGGECNSWVIEDYVYKWRSGGNPVKEGHYIVNIFINTDDPSNDMFWKADYDVTFP